MDVMDAGVFAGKWEARVPKHAKMTLWGPLQSKEMGFEGWEVQDGGETGFVLHNAGIHLTMGRATSTLIFVRRLERAFLTVYMGGYPADAPAGQRRLDMQKAVQACEVFLTRLSKEPIRFELQGEFTLVDNVNDAVVPPRGALASGRKMSAVIDADEEIARKAGFVPATKAKPTKPAIDVEAKPKGKGKADVWEV